MNTKTYTSVENQTSEYRLANISSGGVTVLKGDGSAFLGFIRYFDGSEIQGGEEAKGWRVTAMLLPGYAHVGIFESEQEGIDALIKYHAI